MIFPLMKQWTVLQRCNAVIGRHVAPPPPGVAAAVRLHLARSANFRLRQSLSQHGIWRPAQIGILLLSPPQRSPEPDRATWQTATATRERTSSSVTQVHGRSSGFQSGARRFISVFSERGGEAASLSDVTRSQLTRRREMVSEFVQKQRKLVHELGRSQF